MSERFPFDLDPTSRQALELDAILAYAASFAALEPGREAIRAVVPLASRERLAAEHDAVEQAGRYLLRFGRLIPARLPDPGPALEALAVAGLAAEPLALRDLASVLVEAADLRKRLSSMDGDDLEALRELGRSIPDTGPLAREVVRAVGPDGRLEDDASSELSRLRGAIAKTGERLRRQLEAFLHDPASASVVRDDFVTQRSGRFVIPVRADTPKPVEGIVHAASSSGQTLFVEPIASVAMNNELVRLAEQEAAECVRVVSGWTESFRAKGDDVRAAVAGLVRADTLQARAAFGREIGGCRPAVTAGAPLRLMDARHPLLDKRLREAGSRSVPVTLEVDPYDSLLVISGPNTGGKTVALKTAGLAVVMAHCGLPVAAKEAVLPVFRQLRADIGDHQSIDADLSTFSGHVRAVARFLDEAAPPALFLFDEIGTGTEPGEGAALAQAILERLLALRVTAIATTHHASLKAWAFTTDRVASAAMEFDERTLRPTFRVLAGASGASAGIDVASRLGLAPELVARSRELVGSVGLGAEALMAKLRASYAEAEARTESLKAAEAAFAEERERLRADAEREEARRREASAKSLDGAMREFKEQSRRELASIDDAKERARVERAHLRAASRLSATVRARKEPPSGAVPQAPFAPAPGVRARILSLDRDGEIVAIRGSKVDVRMGAATFTVARADLAPAGEPEPAPVRSKAQRIADLQRASRISDRDDLPSGPPRELHLLGKTADEALPEVDKFLDGCRREGRDEARIVHGHGTGRLRTAVRKHLLGHPLVASFRPGGASEGGDGATVVTLT